MGSVLSTMMRGMLGVVATVFVVAVVWTLYLKRDAVIAASEPVVDLVLERQSTTEEGTATDSPAVAPAAAGSDAGAGVGAGAGAGAGTQ